MLRWNLTLFPVDLDRQLGTEDEPLWLTLLIGNADVVEHWGLVEAADGVLAALLKLLCLVVVEVGELDDRRSHQEQEHGRHETQCDGKQQLKRCQIRSCIRTFFQRAANAVAVFRQ